MILTLRDSQQWYASVMNTIWKLSSNALAESQKRQDDQAIERAMMGDEIIWQGIIARSIA